MSVIFPEITIVVTNFNVSQLSRTVKVVKLFDILVAVTLNYILPILNYNNSYLTCVVLIIVVNWDCRVDLHWFFSANDPWAKSESENLQIIYFVLGLFRGADSLVNNLHRCIFLNGKWQQTNKQAGNQRKVTWPRSIQPKVSELRFENFSGGSRIPTGREARSIALAKRVMSEIDDDFDCSSGFMRRN